MIDFGEETGRGRLTRALASVENGLNVVLVGVGVPKFLVQVPVLQFHIYVTAHLLLELWAFGPHLF